MTLPETKDKTMTLPKISTYGNYSSSNYGAHCLRVELPGITVWFSYQTTVAFETNKSGLVCRRNDWGPTTGKHLNAIEPDKSKRLDSAAFEARFAESFSSR